MMKKRLPDHRDVVLAQAQRMRLEASQLALFDERWLAHGLVMAMVAGCVGSGARYAKPPIEDVAAEIPRIILPDTSIVLSADAQWVDAQPRTHDCSADGGQSASIDGACDVNTLRNAVSNAADLSCYESSTTGFLTYAVVIDCEGRAIELLRLPDQTPLLSGDARQAWLDSLANDRWPCYAGQSVQFTCIVSLFP